MKPIKAPYLTIPTIIEKAEEFRDRYANPPDQMPLDLETIIEIALHILILPKENLSQILHKNGFGIDGYLTSDRTRIMVDKDQYMQDQGRHRLTLAHEIGHWYLHESLYDQMRYDSVSHFGEQQKAMGEHARKGIELQANVFASNLLVPREQLIVLAEKIFPEIYKLAKEEGIDSFSGLNAMLADDMAVNFGVSFEMVQNRLYTEKVVDHLMPKGY